MSEFSFFKMEFETAEKSATHHWLNNWCGLNNCNRCGLYNYGFNSCDSLGEVLRLEVDCTSVESLPLEFDPFSSTAYSGEESHWDASVADHFASDHVFVSHFDVNFVVHVDHFVLKEL